MASFNHLFYVFLQVFTIATFTQSAQIPPTIKSTSSVPTTEPTIRIQCLTGYMLITIKDPPPSTEDGLFSGLIYPRGLSKNSSCISEYRNHNGPLKYKLPLRTCNTMPQETDDGSIEFFNTIVLQPHLKLITDLGRGYKARCTYKNRETATPIRGYGNWENIAETLSSSESVDRRYHARALGRDGGIKYDSLESDPDENGVETKMPGCHMKIYTGDKVAENVKIGDPLTIKIYIDPQEKYGLHITDCLVRDGLGWSEQKLMNSEGCPLDGEIMGQFEYSDDRTKASVSFPAHKFPYTTSVYYQCNAKLCQLKDPECQKPPNCESRRSRRQTAGTDDNDPDAQPATIELYSGLYVNENAEVIDGTDGSVFAEKTPEDALCISQRSFAIAIAIAGLILMLLVVAAVLCIMARRHRKSVSHSGSSIYSSTPYTNTAFSHSS